MTYKINFGLARSLKREKGSERRALLETRRTKQNMEDRYTRSEARSDTGRIGRWLSTRSAETWMFFAAGVFLGGFFF